MDMKKIFCTLSSIIFVYCAFISQVFAEEAIKFSKEEVEQFIKQAKEYAVSKGKEQALKDFMDPSKTQFRKGSLYVFAQDFTGVNLAHIKSSLVGSNMMTLKDPKGIMFIKDMTEMAKKEVKGSWVVYEWQNPTTKAVETKHTFVLKVDDNWWIGAGIYASEMK